MKGFKKTVMATLCTAAVGVASITPPPHFLAYSETQTTTDAITFGSNSSSSILELSDSNSSNSGEVSHTHTHNWVLHL